MEPECPKCKGKSFECKLLKTINKLVVQQEPMFVGGVYSGFGYTQFPQDVAEIYLVYCRNCGYIVGVTGVPTS